MERLLLTHRRARADVTLVTAASQILAAMGESCGVGGGPFEPSWKRWRPHRVSGESQRSTRGCRCFRAPVLFTALHRVRPSAVKHELYLTAALRLLRRAGGRIATVLADDPQEVLGINTRAEVAEAYAVLRRRAVERLMADGVTCLDPATVHVCEPRDRGEGHHALPERVHRGSHGYRGGLHHPCRRPAPGCASSGIG